MSFVSRMMRDLRKSSRPRHRCQESRRDRRATLRPETLERRMLLAADFVGGQPVLETQSNAPRVLFVRGGDRTGGFLEAVNDTQRTEQLADINNFTTGGRNHGWGQLRNVLEGGGFVVEQITEGSETTSGPAEGIHIDLEAISLSQYDVVVFGSNNAVYDQAAIDAFDGYIQAGGSALFISDANFGGDWADAPNSDQQFLSQLGIEVHQDQGTYVVGNQPGEILQPTHPVFAGINSFDGEGVSPFHVAQAVPGVNVLLLAGAEGNTRLNQPPFGGNNRGPSVASGPADASVIAATYGSGRVVGHFDRNTFFNTGGAGTDITRFDNQPYALNLFDWLANGSGALDFGDAPSTYPTLLPGGAAHEAFGPRLGDLRDSELDGQPGAMADGDNNNGGNDEDGVMFGAIQVGTTMAAVNIDLQNATTAKVDAWIDFDGSGTWEASERVFNAQPVSSGIQTINFAIPAGAVSGQTFARVRVSSTGGLDVGGMALDGEVEDYLVNILSAQPQVETVVINDGVDPTRSKVTSLTVQFDSEVNHSALDSAFTITNITDSFAVGAINVAATDANGKTTAVLTFGGTSTISPQLASLATTLSDGNYRMDIAAAHVMLADGDMSTMSTDYAFGGQTAEQPNNDDFFRWYGDANGDGFTDFNDFASGFLPAFGSQNGVGTNYNEGFDANGDGFVDFTDFADNFLPRFGTGRP